VTRGRFHIRSLAPLLLGLGVWLLWPAQTLARALVRFIHAVPGVGTAAVDVNTGSGDEVLGAIGFGQSTQWHSLRSGRFHWSLAGGGRTLAAGTATVGNGAYDIVVLEREMKVFLAVYRAQGGKAGTSLVRVIHAAPELGSPELDVDGKEAVKSLSYTHATPYLSLAPGVHHLGAMRPGDTTPLVAGVTMHLMSGDAYSSLVLGTRGQRVKVVTLVDRGAPLTRRVSTTRSVTGAGPGGTVVVAHGDCLWTIARRALGPQASNEAVWNESMAIYDINAKRIGTGDPNLLFPGTRLQIPRSA
jgi:hypothetical protein